MINVTQEQIEAYNDDSVHKSLRVYFPSIGLTLGNEQIYQESMKLTESLIDGENIEFVGCIASQFCIQVHDVEQNLKNQPIEVYIKTDNTSEIPLFKGIVDSAKMQTNRRYKDITAYDRLYTKGQIDVAYWYNHLSFPITLGQLRNSLFSHIGLTQVSTTLPNDNVTIEKQYDPKVLKCLTVIKSICQINGCFGIINRSGLFEYRFIANAFERVYPAFTLFPSSSLFPVSAYQGGTDVANNFSFYKQIQYEEYSVKPVQRLQIRKSEDDNGVTVGESSGNKYIIQNNMFARGLDNSTLSSIGNNIYSQINDISFHPCDTDNNGLPFVEVGDVVTYVLPTSNTRNSQGSYDVNTFNVMKREITGIQALRDNYNAEGEEEQSEFITDVQAQIDTIKQNGVSMDDYYTKDYIDDTFIPADEQLEICQDAVATEIEYMETPTGLTVVSCYTLPTQRQANTLYLVGANVVVL